LHGIDIPIVLTAGIIALVPLMTFEVFIEAWYSNEFGICLTAGCALSRSSPISGHSLPGYL